MKVTSIARTKKYSVKAILREDNDPKSVSEAVRISVGGDEIDLTESQALNLADSIDKAIEMLRFA